MSRVGRPAGHRRRSRRRRGSCGCRCSCWPSCSSRRRSRERRAGRPPSGRTVGRRRPARRRFRSAGRRPSPSPYRAPRTGRRYRPRTAGRPCVLNPVNARAVQIVDDGLQLGFVPDPLLDYVHSVIDTGAYELTVVRANPAETHPHLRLLLRLAGRCTAFAFDGADWRSAER